MKYLVCMTWTGDLEIWFHSSLLEIWSLSCDLGETGFRHFDGNSFTYPIGFFVLFPLGPEELGREILGEL